jgi:competence protein ComEA
MHMIKKILVAMLALFAAVAFAAVDANKATQAELEAVKGIGPVIAGKILDERKKGSFKDWQDMVTRVKGVGEGNAAKFSTEGLTVNGAAFAGAPAKAAAPAAAKKEDKPAAKVEAPKAAAPAAAPAASAAAPAAKPATTSADDKKAAAMKAKEEKAAAKADKAAAKKAAKEGKDTKEAKPAAAVAPASAAKK